MTGPNPEKKNVTSGPTRAGSAARSKAGRTKTGPARRGPAPKGAAAEALAEYRRKRDFSRTSEPSGIEGDDAAGAAAAARAHLPAGDEAPSGSEIEKQPSEHPVFVVQKHDASSLHYDLRLEMGGVLKSWAVPKGPSLDPADRRLAVMVEDHPLDYATFEGRIPEGEYGGGTVMVWDFGWWEPDLDWINEAKKGRHRKSSGAAEAPGGVGTESNAAAFDPEEELAAGDLKFILHGRKLTGSWALVQMKGRGKKNWLLLKHRDGAARPGSDITSEAPDSAATGRSLEQIAADEAG